MLCQHTVPDWHRYVKPTADALPILAGCRLLVKEGETASDPRSIACSYWGHQRDCPLYDGPGEPARTETGRAPVPASRDVPVALETVWPVRTPGARETMRGVMIGLGVLSTALLSWTAVLGLSVLSGKASPASLGQAALVAATVSIITHVLAMLRTWARR
jgi:hypothetical protein